MAQALVFDSGVGGLSVVEEIRALMPELGLTYVADDAFRPYGNKSRKELRARLSELMPVLYDTVKPDLIVIACNTASTTALDDIRASVPCPVVGVVPAIKPASKRSRTKALGVLGTPGTIQRKYVDSLIQDFASECHVVLQGSVGLVNLAERKLAGETLNISDIRQEIAPLFEGRIGADIDMVVLACTHFPLLKDELKAAATQSVTWIDSGAAIARRVSSIVAELHSDTPSEKDVALLIAKVCPPTRRKAFGAYGFDRVIALEPSTT